MHLGECVCVCLCVRALNHAHQRQQQSNRVSEQLQQQGQAAARTTTLAPPATTTKTTMQTVLIADDAALKWVATCRYLCLPVCVCVYWHLHMWSAASVAFDTVVVACCCGRVNNVAASATWVDRIQMHITYADLTYRHTCIHTHVHLYVNFRMRTHTEYSYIHTPIQACMHWCLPPLQGYRMSAEMYLLLIFNALPWMSITLAARRLSCNLQLLL